MKPKPNRKKAIAYHAMWWAVRSVRARLNIYVFPTNYVEDQDKKLQHEMRLHMICIDMIQLARHISKAMGYKPQMSTELERHLEITMDLNAKINEPR